MPVLTLGTDLSGIDAADLAQNGCVVDVSFLNRCRSAIQAEELFVAHGGNHLELYAMGEYSESVVASWLEFIHQHLGLSENILRKRVYDLDGDEAVAHFLRTAIGLSQDRELGRSLEGFRKSFALAREAGLTGPHLNRLFQRGLWLAEKIRIELNLQKNAITPQSVVTDLAEKIFGDLSDHTAMVIGSEAAGRPFVEQLHDRRIGKVLFANGKNPSGGKRSRQDEIQRGQVAQSLTTADILLLLDEDIEVFLREIEISKVMSRRKNAPLLFVCDTDAAPPPKTKRTLDNIYNVYYYNNFDLDKIVTSNLQEHKKVTDVINDLIESEVKDFFSWVEAKEWHRYGKIIGRSQAMQSILELVARIAQTDITVLIDGESGTGKELVARSIHDHSTRAEQKFIAVNCGAVPESLLESELFGHVRGAFTGATANKKGLFEEANHGTILLDEIGETSQSMQVKLLRFLQEGEIKPVGSNQTLHLDVRLITATNRDLEQMVGSGSFRKDLYYRLNVIQITVPPLRDRRDDILPLAEFFMDQYAQKFNKTVFGMDQTVKRTLCDHDWPGNVRELENTMERAVALTPEKRISVSDLPPAMSSPRPDNEEPVIAGNLSLKQLERHHIEATLQAHDWNYDLVTKILGIGRTTLWRKMKAYNISNTTTGVGGDGDSQTAIGDAI